MNKLLACAAFAVSLTAAPMAFAAEQTITLAVSNMDCADCPFIVQKSLERVPGVAKVAVSLRTRPQSSPTTTARPT